MCIGDNNKKLKIFYTNADSLHNKLYELDHLLNNSAPMPDIIIVTEAKPKRSCHMNVSEYSLPHYRMFTNNFDDDNRGIIIYVNPELRCDIVAMDCAFSEHLFLKIHLVDMNKCLLIGCVYRSPSSTAENDDLLLELINTAFAHKNFNTVDTIVVGDFNFPSIDWDRWVCTDNKLLCNKFLETLRDNFILQHVSYATRARNNTTPHILDLVLTDKDIIKDIKFMSPLGNSDHSILDISCDCNEYSRITSVDKFNFAKGNYAGLVDAFNIDWDLFFDDCSNNINQMWVKFRQFVIQKTEEFVPKVNHFHTWKKKLWKRPLNGPLRQTIRKKHRAWNRYIETKNPAKLLEYKKIRNVVTSQISNLRAQEQYDISVSCKDNPKKFWKYINSKRKTKSDIGELIRADDCGNTSVANTDELKAEVLCKAFGSVFTPEKDINTCQLPVEHSGIIGMDPISMDKSIIMSKLSKLNVNKSAGPDDIYPRVLYEAKAHLVYPLLILFNASLKAKQLPVDWCTANVVPIYKKGDKKNPLNYRPISLTSIICKVLESIIRDSVISHFVNNDLFSTQQYGFLKGRNTVIQLIKMFDQWSESLEEGGHIDVIYTDLEKAFDKVPHNRLVEKLKFYKVNPDIIDWICSFLSNRKMRVRINNKFSSWISVISGIPQGSILGPLLFIIFINDLPEVCGEVSNILLYADDAKLFMHILSQDDRNKLQNMFNNVQSWIENWHLSLNIDKCVTVSYGRHIDDSHFYLLHRQGSDFMLQKQDSFKDLGVTFQSDLSFKNHIAEKINKAHAILGIIKRNFRGLKQDTFIILYKTLVRSHLEYANSLWNPYQKQDIKALEKVQMRATKLVTALAHKSYEERLRILDLPTLKFRRLRGDMIETYKVLSGCYDTTVSPHIPLISDHATRGNSLKIANRRCHYNLRKYSFCLRITNVWNSLPFSVVTAPSVNSFKNRLDNHWASQELRYDWEAEISGTGSRSRVEF